ncbi:MAG TPA: bifunctional riboflavin kinase/FAD synthetase [Candidatus Bathyarchaeia archaeon]|nr:bifunctional riboflavin kinase/FAD synthetase [Candidatus Bathyarchaeia archaeon]
MMKIIRGISRFRRPYPKSVLAIGVFDGLHHGHRALIARTVARAKKIKGTSVVMTFDPHPMNVLHPQKKLPLIASLDYRLKLLQDMGVDVCLVARFTKRFAQMDPVRFIEHYMVRRMNAVEVVVGKDFRFGFRRRGDNDLLKRAGERYGFVVHAVSLLKSGDRQKVSSTHIRKLISDGDIYHAGQLLDRPVSIMGRVVVGDRRGRQLGYPTANLDSSVTGFAPRGVFCVRVYIGSKVYTGMANVGSRPSFKKEKSVSIEVHLFDVDENFYGKMMRVEFLKKIRRERIFVSRQAFIDQLHHDERLARAWFAVH